MMKKEGRTANTGFGKSGGSQLRKLLCATPKD